MKQINNLLRGNLPIPGETWVAKNNAIKTVRIMKVVGGVVDIQYSRSSSNSLTLGYFLTAYKLL